MLSDERIAEIRARAQAATPGPWFEMPHFHDEDGPLPEPEFSGCIDSANDGEVIYGVRNPNDSIFAASARQDIPDLLDEVERLRAERDRLLGVCREHGEARESLQRTIDTLRSFDVDDNRRIAEIALRTSAAQKRTVEALAERDAAIARVNILAQALVERGHVVGDIKAKDLAQGWIDWAAQEVESKEPKRA